MHLVKIATESFKGIVAFRNEKDLEGLRYFVGSEILQQWQTNWNQNQAALFYSDVKVTETKLITSDETTFTVEFTGEWKKQGLKKEEFSERWTFEKNKKRWIVTEMKQANTAQEVLEIFKVA